MAESPIDALIAVADSAVRKRTIPAATYSPPPTTDNPNPASYTVPAREVVEVDPATLPPEVVNSDGRVSLTQQVAMLWGAVGQVPEQEIRTVAGRVTMNSGSYQAGATQDLSVTWDQAPLRSPTGGVVAVQAAVAWLGRVTAVVVPGTLTTAGCTVRARFLGTVAPTSGSPVTVEAQGMYLWTPPHEGGT
jgi:hypothetical protein